MPDLDPALAALVAAAATLTGPGATLNDVEDRAVKLALMATPDSAFARRLARVLSSTPFVAELAQVELEQSSQRGVLRLHTEPTDDRPDGIEHIRTDRIDTREGRQLYDVACGLVGRKVLVRKLLEDMAGGTKRVRVAVQLVDLGPAPVRNRNGRAS